MTLFEYLAIAFSLVFSFSAMRLLSGLPYAIRPGARYWVHLTWVHLHLLGTAVTFWAFWGYRGADWTLWSFLLALASPAAVFFIACSLVPDNPSTVTSWRNHYYSARRSLFLGQIVWALVAAGATTSVFGLSWFHPTRLGQVALLLIGALGMSLRGPRVHAGLAMGAVVVVLIATSTVYLLPVSPAR